MAQPWPMRLDGKHAGRVEHPFGLGDEIADSARRAQILRDHNRNDRHADADLKAGLRHQQERSELP